MRRGLGFLSPEPVDSEPAESFPHAQPLFEVIVVCVEWIRVSISSPIPLKEARDECCPSEELLYEALETELRGVQVYEMAISCAVNEDLRKEWEKHGAETKTHVQVVEQVFERLDLTFNRDFGQEVVRHKAGSLLKAMEMAKQAGDPAAAQLVAAECVVDAETKDHANWELIGKIAEEATGDRKEALTEAYEQVGEQEDMHLYHTMGWTRELWIESLGMPAVLPPPEEEKKVTAAIVIVGRTIPRRHALMAEDSRAGLAPPSLKPRQRRTRIRVDGHRSHTGRESRSWSSW